jgi:hypothetical protein
VLHVEPATKTRAEEGDPYKRCVSYRLVLLCRNDNNLLALTIRIAVEAPRLLHLLSLLPVLSGYAADPGEGNPLREEAAALGRLTGFSWPSTE